MILDERLEFADALAINTGGANTYLLGDVIDLQSPSGGPVLQDIGLGEEIFFVITVDTLFASATGTIYFQLVSDSVATLLTSQTVHFATAVDATPFDAAGTVLAAVALPLGNYERYLGVLQITGTAAFTAGKINAFLTKDVSKWVAYPNAVGA